MENTVVTMLIKNLLSETNEEKRALYGINAAVRDGLTRSMCRWRGPIGRLIFLVSDYLTADDLGGARSEYLME